jgi:hypothetical protein
MEEIIMSTNRTLLLLFFAAIFGQYIFGAGTIEESDIPMPEVQYDLPEILVGDFILINHWVEREIKIFSNNKFISWQQISDQSRSEHYGYVVKKEDSWYLVPANKSLLNNRFRQHPFLSDITKITLLDTGFSFHERGSNELNIAIPKINLTEEMKIATDVTLSWRIVRRQYYLFDQPNSRQIIDFHEITNIENFPPLYHDLVISNGIVTLARHFNYNGTIRRMIDDLWRGFFEKNVETLGEINGIIRFTNGVPYYYVKDGIAILEIKNDNVIITIQCSDEEERRIQEKYPYAQSPIFLVLEF